MLVKKTILILTIVLIFSCGMPSFQVLPPPVSLSFTGNDKVGFQTVAEPGLLRGYVIYYKIYPQGDIRISNDRKRFDPSTYENENAIPIGPTLPVSLGFSRMGFVGDERSDTTIIDYTTAGDEVALDFTDAQSQANGIDPLITLNGVSNWPSPARAIRYSDATFGQYNTGGAGGNTLKRFVKNYEYQNSVNYRDLDLRYISTATTIINIAFVAYSFGYDGVDRLESLPVYLGEIEQIDFEDNSLDEPVFN